MGNTVKIQDQNNAFRVSTDRTFIRAFDIISEAYTMHPRLAKILSWKPYPTKQKSSFKFNNVGSMNIFLVSLHFSPFIVACFYIIFTSWGIITVKESEDQCSASILLSLNKLVPSQAPVSWCSFTWDQIPEANVHALFRLRITSPNT